MAGGKGRKCCTSPITAPINFLEVAKPLPNLPERIAFRSFPASFFVLSSEVKVGSVCGGGEERKEGRKGSNRLMNGATKFVRLLAPSVDPFTVSLEVASPPPLNGVIDSGSYRER